MSLPGLLLGLLLQAGAAPEAPAPVAYPLGVLREPDLEAPGDPFHLTDLRYSLTDEGSTFHAFAARFRVKDWGYLGFESEGERRGLSAMTQRTLLRLDEEDGSWRLFSSYRAPFLLVESDVRQRTPAEGRGWIASGLLSGRLSPDVELIARYVGDTHPEPRAPELSDRFLRAASLGLLWQPGASFEAFAEASHSRVRTSGGLEFEQDEWLAWAGGALGAAELEGELGLQNGHGRFPRREWRALADARVPLFGRVLLEAGTTNRVESGGERVAHEYRGALTLFGRRVHLARTGPAALEDATLARHATALGYNERRAVTDDERREQRERLALSSRRDELRGEALALYRAQVDERNVPLLGLEASSGSDALLGVDTRRYGLLVGVPWPPAWPWTEDERTAAFLELRLSRQRDVYSAGYVARTLALSLDAHLNREMSVAVRWSRPDPTPLDIVRAVARPRTFEIAYVYAYGR